MGHEPQDGARVARVAAPFTSPPRRAPVPAPPPTGVCSITSSSLWSFSAYPALAVYAWQGGTSGCSAWPLPMGVAPGKHPPLL